MGFVPLVVAAATIWKVVDFVKFAKARDVSSAATQILTWVAGIVMAFLLAKSDFAGGIDVSGMALGDLNAYSVVLFGLGLGSTASGVVDYKKARDNTDSASVPSLIPESQVPVFADDPGDAPG